MSKIKLTGHASGSGVLTIAAPNTDTDRTITLPDVTGTLLDSGSDLPAANLTGTVADARISALTASKLTGTLPAISGANLTNLPAQTLTGLTDTTVSTSDPTGTSNVSATGHLWVNKSSGETYVCTDATNNANIWMNVASGSGDIGDSPENVEYLVIAGGGGGGGSGGGGGAGGYRTASSFAVGSGSITLTVGAGGAGGNTQTTRGSNGSNSVFSTITSLGGGGGGHLTYDGQPQNHAGLSGGSGGGAGVDYPVTSVTGAGAGTSGQGNNGGGSAWNENNDNYASGGGGGAGAVGGDGGGFAYRTAYGGAGGNGLASSITGSSVTRAGGGGGQSYGSNVNNLGGAGGSGGGGAKGSAGTANTGGGGGGPTKFGDGKSGGSGIVIIAYPDNHKAITTIPGTLTYSVSTSSRSGYRVYSFTAGTGSIVF